MPDEGKQRGVFCVETVWYGEGDKTSMRPVLEAMHEGYLGIPVVYRTAVTSDELRHYLEEWKSLDGRRYPMLYLGYHGEAGHIVLGQQDYWGESSISLEQLAEGLGDECQNRVVHLGSCSTLNVEKSRINNFLKNTNVSAVSGYQEEVDWTESVAFDMLYIKEMQSGGQQSLTPTVMKGIRDGNGKRWGLIEEDGGYGRSPYFEWGQYLGFRLDILG